MKTLLCIIVLLIAMTINAQSVTKLVKDLDDEESCVYAVLEKVLRTKLVQEDSPLFEKVTISRNNHDIRMTAMVRAELKAFRTTSYDTVLKYSILLRAAKPDEVEKSGMSGKASSNSDNEPKVLKKDPGFLPGEVKITNNWDNNDGWINRAQCLTYNWEIVSDGAGEYCSSLTADTDYFIPNEHNYESVYYADKNYAIVKKGGKFGVIGRQGNILMETKYDYMIKNNHGLLIREGKAYYFFDPVNNKRLTPEYMNANPWAMYYLKQNLFPIGKEGEMTLLNSHFEEITPRIYRFFQLSGGTTRDRALIASTRSAKDVILDPISGKEISAHYDNIYASMPGRKAFSVELGGRYGIVSKDGVELINPKYDLTIAFYGDKLAQVFGVKQNGKWALFNNGKALTEFRYDIMGQAGSIISVVSKGKYGAINKNGKIIIPIEYDNLMDFDEKGTRFIKVFQGSRFIKYDAEGNCIENCK